MDFKQLRNFVAVADHHSFTKAAKGLGLSQPALTVSIRNLENEIGAALLSRTRKNVELTEIGSEFAVYACSALRELEKARALTALPTTNRVRTVTFGVNSIVARIIAKSVISKFSITHPNIRFEIEITTAPQAETIERVSSGRWDFGVMLGNLPGNFPKDLVAKKCLRLTSAPHVRKSHPLAGSSVITLAALSEYRWIMSTMTVEDTIPSLFHRAGVKRPIVLTRANSFDLIMTLLQEHDFVTILPSEIVSRYYANRFVKLPIKNIEFHSNLYLVSSRDREISSSSRLVMEMISSFLISIG